MSGFLSFLCPGLGQLCQGRLMKAIFFFVGSIMVGLVAGFVAAFTFGFGIIIAIPFWVWCIMDASKFERTQEDKKQKQLLRAISSSHANPFN